VIVSNDSIERLEGIFQERYESMVAVHWQTTALNPMFGRAGFRPSGTELATYQSLDEGWVVFLDGHDCVVMSLSEIKNSFQDMVNFDSCLREGLCVPDPHSSGCRFIIVPRQFAEKVLVMGGFPD